MRSPALILIILLSTFIAPILAVPTVKNPLVFLLEILGLGGLANDAPQPLATTIHSPECADLNNGTYVCCEGTFNGGSPLVLELSGLTDYPITKNTINGLMNCQRNPKTCYPGTKLCCGSITLIPALALYCQQVPE